MTQLKRDYYEVLGVSRSAGIDEIKNAFRARARRLHPDVSAEPEAEEQFRELAEAYGVLSKPTARLLYDRFGYRGRGNGGFGPAPSIVRTGEELFDWLTGGRRRRSSSALAEIELEFLDAARGGTREVRWQAVAPCGQCGGSGGAPGSPPRICGECQGSGRLRKASDYGSGRLLQIETCFECGGTGRLLSNPCEACGGDGRVAVERVATVHIAPGVEDGERIPLPGEAERGYAVVRVRPLPADSLLVRAVALVGLLVAMAFLIVLLFFT